MPPPFRGTHEVRDGGLLQFGHSKDDPRLRPQDQSDDGLIGPLGMPLATDVRSGERADDGSAFRSSASRGRDEPTELLFVGDCKMSALDTRAYVVGRQHMYLSPLH